MIGCRERYQPPHQPSLSFARWNTALFCTSQNGYFYLLSIQARCLSISFHPIFPSCFPSCCLCQRHCYCSMTLFPCHSKMLLLALSLLCPLISTFEVTARSADSVQERQESAVCLFYNAGMPGSLLFVSADRPSLTRVGSSSAWCLNNEQCQVATALTPAIIFCGTFGAIPHTTENDYNPSMGCEESCWSVARIYHALLPYYLPCFA